MSEQMSVLTIATGKKIYLDMAVNLARSFRRWNAGNGIDFYLATDQPAELPADVAAFAKTIGIKPGELGQGFSPKVNLDKLAPEGQTLFIDSDCLVYGDLTSVFEKFRGHAVSVVGGYISSGEWFGDVAAICKKFAITGMLKFNGGIYYLENGEQAKKVYELTRQLEHEYDEIGFVRFRGMPADEMLMSLALSVTSQTPITDDGTIMSDPLSCPGPYKTDVIKGKTSLNNPPAPSALHQPWYPFTNVSPLIVHFLGHHNADHQYRKDVYRLARRAGNSGAFLSDIYAAVFIGLKSKVIIKFKNTFRGLYHSLLGTRRLKPGER